MTRTGEKRDWSYVAEDNVIYLKGPDIADPWGEALINQLEEKNRGLGNECEQLRAERGRLRLLSMAMTVVTLALSVVLLWSSS